MSLLPVVMPFSGRGRAQFQPIWVSDVADSVMSVLASEHAGGRRYELVGPDVLTHVPTPIVASVLRALERVIGPSAFATWDEAELMEVPMLPSAGMNDIERLGVNPRSMASVFGVS
jgi:uncharacterized protein YbjT (DUF2867 family)